MENWEAAAGDGAEAAGFPKTEVLEARAAAAVAVVGGADVGGADVGGADVGGDEVSSASTEDALKLGI